MLPSLTAAFLTGLLAGSQTPYVPIVLSGILLGIALALTWLERAGRLDARSAGLWYGALLAGTLYWVLATPLPTFQDSRSSRSDTAPAGISGRIVGPVQHAPGRLTLVLETDEAPSRTVRVVWREPDALLLQGDRIQFHGRLHPPGGSLNPGGFDYAAYVDRQGIEAVATVSGPGGVRLVQSGAVDWRWRLWNRIDQWRSRIREAAIHTLTQPALGIFLGIVIGERGYLQQDLQEGFMVTGTVHLLSISGSHLGLVAMVIFWLVRRLVLSLPSRWLLGLSCVLTPSRVAILATWPMVCAYALLAGAELATIRSLVMITMALMAVWLGQTRHAYHAMAVAALLIVWHDPRAILDISFQLSFLSVLMMVRCGWWIVRWEEEAGTEQAGIVRAVGRYGRDALLISGGVTLATLPVVAFYFYQIPWLGIVTNLVAIPFTGIVLVPIGLAGAIATLATGQNELVLGSLEESFLTWFIGGIRWCAGIPGGEWHVAAPSVPMMVVFYAALWTATTTLDSGRRRMIGAATVVMLVCWWTWSPRLGIDGDRWRVTFLDVGQGDSAVIELPDGQTVLIDGGARYERFDMGRGVVAPFLWNRGIRHLDHVIGTHQQLDHVGGLIWVLRHLSVDRYWGTGVERPEQFVADLKSVLKERHLTERVAAKNDEVLPSGPCRLTILNSTQPEDVHPVVYARSGSSLNNQSIVSRLQCGAHSILFSADIETEGLHRLTGRARAPVTILKVPHHGARSSLDRGWLQDIHPQRAVISVGRSNSYGHPAPLVLQALAEEQAGVSRTDLDGAVWITGRLSQSEVVVTHMREVALHPITGRTAIWSAERENWSRLWLQLIHSDAVPFFRL